MTIEKITSGNRVGYKAVQVTKSGKIVVSICPTREEALQEVTKELCQK
jgi:hypothetical protein